MFWIGGRLREVVAHGGSTVTSHSDWLFNFVLKSIVTVTSQILDETSFTPANV